GGFDSRPPPPLVPGRAPGPPERRGGHRARARHRPLRAPPRLSREGRRPESRGPAPAHPPHRWAPGPPRGRRGRRGAGRPGGARPGPRRAGEGPCRGDRPRAGGARRAREARAAGRLLPAPGADRDRRHSRHQPRAATAVGRCREALQDAAGYTDVEFDLGAGTRSRRGAGARAALLAACPAAEDALVVNNGAAALLLATTALAAGRDVLWSRG